jgi:anti-sigma factor RsiW
MSLCDEVGLKALLYLEKRLEGQELQDFLEHLKVCPTCRARVEEERALSRVLHQSRPLYSAPAGLRARVTAMMEQHQEAAIDSPETFYERFLRSIRSGFADPVRRFERVRLLAAVVGVALLALAFVPNAVRHVRAADYVETAVTTHRSYLDGHLEPGIRSDSPEQVTSWFEGKVPFSFRLPNAQATPGGTPKYQLAGASLVSYRGQPAALVIYKKEKEKITLLVASSDSATAAGGDEVRYGSLLFHYQVERGFHVFTWSNHGLTYALVSSVSGLSGSAQESCMVCHESMKDHQNF